MVHYLLENVVDITRKKKERAGKYERKLNIVYQQMRCARSIEALKGQMYAKTEQ